MKRGVFLLVLAALAAALPVQVAPAAGQQFSVYEIYQVDKRARYSYVPVSLYVDTQGKAGLMAATQIAPRKEGGWNRTKHSVLMYNPTESRFQVYGPEAGAQQVPCPLGKEVCGEKAIEYMTAWSVFFKPAKGNRYLVAVPPQDAWVMPPWGWRAKQVAIGARVVMADQSSALGTFANGTKYEVFHEATASGGPYGSGAFALVPCDEKADAYGSASLSSDGTDTAVAIPCEGGWDVGFSSTRDGRTWTVIGPVVGEYDYPNRLFVFDNPKR